MVDFKIILPNTCVQVDLINPPSDFDLLVANSFAGYTKGTRKEYTFEDKLRYIDVIRHRLNYNRDDDEIVRDYIKDRVDWELDEYGNLPDKDDFWSLEAFEDFVAQGDRKLCFRTGDHHIDEKIQKSVLRLITIVVNWDGE